MPPPPFPSSFGGSAGPGRPARHASVSLSSLDVSDFTNTGEDDDRTPNSSDSDSDEEAIVPLRIGDQVLLRFPKDIQGEPQPSI